MKIIVWGAVGWGVYLIRRRRRRRSHGSIIHGGGERGRWRPTYSLLQACSVASTSSLPPSPSLPLSLARSPSRSLSLSLRLTPFLARSSVIPSYHPPSHSLPFPSHPTPIPSRTPAVSAHSVRTIICHHYRSTPHHTQNTDLHGSPPSPHSISNRETLSSPLLPALSCGVAPPGAARGGRSGVDLEGAIDSVWTRRRLFGAAESVSVGGRM
jgi:hypothetical protein